MFLLLFMAPFSRLYAQRIAGKVTDRETGQPIALATLVSGTALAFTAADGQFTLPGVRLGDTVSVTCIGYRRFRLPVDVRALQGPVVIRLEPVSIVCLLYTSDAADDLLCVD